jgi:GntR family transcriptional regulator/MocR family aminotransferase
VLEDDCDAEFRWTGKPLPPLATLDRSGRVVYCGTFSKTLAPGLRIGFALFPPGLIEAATRLRTLWDRGPGDMAQATLTEFMRRGLLVPHIRRTRTEYAKRREAVLGALAAHCGNITPLPAPGGLHMAALLPDGADEATFVRAAQRLGVGIAPGAAYRLRPAAQPSIVLGFASTPVALATHAARALAKAIRS